MLSQRGIALAFRRRIFRGLLPDDSHVMLFVAAALRRRSSARYVYCSLIEIGINIALGRFADYYIVSPHSLAGLCERRESLTALMALR